MIMLYRKSYEEIKHWYFNSDKALLVDDARQAEKTTLIEGFFDENHIPYVGINLQQYINFVQKCRILQKR